MCVTVDHAEEVNHSLIPTFRPATGDVGEASPGSRELLGDLVEVGAELGAVGVVLLGQPCVAEGGQVGPGDLDDRTPSGGLGLEEKVFGSLDLRPQGCDRGVRGAA